MSSPASQKKVSFRAKETTECPICLEGHHKESMLQGGGRLIAGNLAVDLRRLYEKNKKFGRVSPGDYAIVVCPKCLFAAFPKDFSALQNTEIDQLKRSMDYRQKTLTKIFGPLDFKEDRNIVTGAASYLLAIECYQMRVPALAPTPKKAICAMRCAWYLSDLHEDFPHLGYDKLRDILYQKAAIYYGFTLEYMTNGAEPVDVAVSLLGPDTDTNFGFDGVIYLNAYLTKIYKDQLAKDQDEMIVMLSQAKRSLAKLYGQGKSTKGKPGPLLEMSKTLYEEYSAILESLGGER